MKPALVVCDYAKAERPRIPFPYFAETMTGFEYATAAHMLFEGMTAEGLECISATRRRYDGERRNPWDEAECGHHYARAMAAWSGIVALSGFHYNAGKLCINPQSADFRSFWATGTGWGTFTHRAGKTELSVLFGHLPVGSNDYQRRRNLHCMIRPWLIPVGGFLGAGKTTLILSAARILSARGLKCAAIMNDQAGDLVDSAYVTAQGVITNEVTGGCFCCRFSDLIDKADQLRALSPDVIFLEPVGSCTDLSATILQPLKHDFAHQYRLAPLTVVVDPARDVSDPNISFLFKSQLAEADLVLANGTAHGVSGFRQINALTGDGVPAWLDELLSGTLPVGAKLLTIDYEQYARPKPPLAGSTRAPPSTQFLRCPRHP